MTRRTPLPAIALTLASLVGLAACGGSGGSDSASSSDTTTSAVRGGINDTSGANSQGAGGHCGQWVPGQNGIIQTFCAGEAKVTVTIAGKGKPKTFTGAVCTPSDQFLSVNAGALAGTDFSGEVPDYFGANFPPGKGAFTKPVALALNLGGTRYAVGKVTGESDGTKGSFTGSVITGGNKGAPDLKVTGTFAC